MDANDFNKASNLNHNELKASIVLLNKHFDSLNRNLKHDLTIVDFVHDMHSQLLSLFTHVRTCLNTFKNLKKKCKRKLSAELTAHSCQLKRKKLREKSDTLNRIAKGQQLLTVENTARETASRNSTFFASDTYAERITLLCYVCKKRVNTKRHAFYDQLCHECATFNYDKRFSRCDLTDYSAVVTGCRIKIGYEICLTLLRCKCQVIGTTRFARDAFLRFSKEADFEQFKNLLTIYPLDLRDLNGVAKFIKYLTT